MGLSKSQVNRILDNFIDNISYYSKDDFKDLRNTIADYYYNDLKLLNRITVDKKNRFFFSSPRLIHKMISEINGARFTFQEDSISNELFEVIRILNLHENQFFDNRINIGSIDLIFFSLTHLNDEIVKKNKTANYKKEIDNLYSYFKRIISEIEIGEKDRNKYRTLFDKLKINFQAGNYIYANIYFRFFFYYHDNEKLEKVIKNEVHNITIAYINYEPDPTKLKAILESACDIDFIFKLEGQYLTTIYLKCKKLEDYACSFYDYFDNKQKQQLIESWVPTNRDKSIMGLKNILAQIEFKIPNKPQLGNRILKSAKVLNFANERQELYNVFHSLKLNKVDYDFSEYSQQIIDLVCNGDINMQKLGLYEYQGHKKFIDKNKLKAKAEFFLITLFNNIPAYHEQIMNIFNAKIGIAKNYVDRIIAEQSTTKSQILNYLISTDDSEFYEILISKLHPPTVKEINISLADTMSKSQANHNKMIDRLMKHPNLEYLDSKILEKLRGK